MVIRKITCDFCGKEIIGSVIRINANVVDNNTGDFIDEFDIKQNERDYHMECAKKILEFANVGISQEDKEESVKETKQPTEEESAKKKKKLDIGKIFALKNAGWTYKKIADEMGTTPESIASTVYAYKKRNDDKEGK